MDRREFILLGISSQVAAISGCTAPRAATDSPPQLPRGRFDAPPSCEPENGSIASDLLSNQGQGYIHAKDAPVDISVEPSEVKLDEKVTFTIQNSSSSKIGYTTNTPFTILQSQSGGWKEILVVSSGQALSSAYVLEPEGTVEIELAFTRQGISNTELTVCDTISDGAFAFAFATNSRPFPTKEFPIL